MKKLIASILVGVLLFATACGNGRTDNDNNGYINIGRDTNRRAAAQPTAATGRFMETDITPPITGPFISFLAHDGSLVAFDGGLQTKFSSSDGGQTWEQTPGPGYGTERFIMMRSAALLPDGSIITFLFMEGIVKIHPDGTTTHVPIARIDEGLAIGDSIHISLLEVLSDDRLLIGYTVMELTQMHFGGALEADDEDDDYNSDDEPTGRPQAGAFQMSNRMEMHTAIYSISTGAVVAEIDTEGAASAAAGDEYFYLLDTREHLISSFNISTGAASGQTPISLAAVGGIHIDGLRIMGIGGGILALDNYGQLMALHGNNLLHTYNGELDVLLDGNAFSFGTPTGSVSSLKVLADGSIVIGVLTGTHQNRLYKYFWDENAVINPARTLTVWSLTNNDLVRATITELRRRHPDAYISYEVALSGNMGISASDAIRTLNTRLLSGRGPDILIMDGTPVENYVGRGMLLDLSGKLDTSDIYQNLLGAYLQPNGGLYALPMQLRIPALVACPRVLGEIRTFGDFVNRVITGNPTPPTDGQMMHGGLGGIPEDERPELSFINLRELFDFMWLASAAAVVSDNQLHSDALNEFFAALEAISDMYELGVPPEMEGHVMGMAMFGGAGRPVLVPNSLMRFITHSTNMAVFNVDHLMILGMLSHRDYAEVKPFPGLVPNVWLPSTVVGVSADTEVPEFATEFVAAMLTPDIQRMNYGEGLPITREGIVTQVQELNERQAQMEQEPLNVDLDAVIRMLQTPAVVETAIIDIIWETAERLCTGAIDLEGAVREVEQNI
ncbi:MAG: hypothetical protein FWC32_03580, partial [Firmicutes bacterium]|nr:hypothetical protein [Bacillota bacterium]